MASVTYLFKLSSSPALVHLAVLETPVDGPASAKENFLFDAKKRKWRKKKKQNTQLYRRLVHVLNAD